MAFFEETHTWTIFILVWSNEEEEDMNMFTDVLVLERRSVQVGKEGTAGEGFIYRSRPASEPPCDCQC